MTLGNHRVTLVPKAIGVVSKLAGGVVRRFVLQLRNGRPRAVVTKEYYGIEFSQKEWVL
jgi:hypothetical protein